MAHYDKQRLEQQERELRDWSEQLHKYKLNSEVQRELTDIVNCLVEFRKEIDELKEMLNAKL